MGLPSAAQVPRGLQFPCLTLVFVICTFAGESMGFWSHVFITALYVCVNTTLLIGCGVHGEELDKLGQGE